MPSPVPLWYVRSAAGRNVLMPCLSEEGWLSSPTPPAVAGAHPLSGNVCLTVFPNGTSELASTCGRSSEMGYRVKWLERCCVPIVVVFRRLRQEDPLHQEI